jgi:hypothetical protein
VSRACALIPAIHASGLVERHRKIRKGQPKSLAVRVERERSTPGNALAAARRDMLGGQSAKKSTWGTEKMIPGCVFEVVEDVSCEMGPACGPADAR